MVFLSQEIFQAMVNQAQSALPNEVCGILAIHRDKVMKIYPVTNRDASPIHFQLEPLEQFHIFQEMEREGWKRMGIYHSHGEAKAYPSAEDIGNAHDPEALHFIFSLRDRNRPELRSFWIRDGKVEEEEIEREG
jgi:[CysO sulfur-carrier protein]-S-L-cysteine hydrolase